MVVRVEPLSLVDLSARVLVDSLIRSWLNIVDLLQLDSQHNTDTELSNVVFIEHIPYFISDKIFDLLFRSYVDYYCIETRTQTKKNIKKLPFFCNLLTHILVPSLTVLDLNYLHISKMKNVICKSNEILSCTHHALVKQIPFLSNLVQLNLQCTETLAICGDSILKQVGQHCPKLKFLDVSQNSIVSDVGLQFLIPSKTHSGCSMLKKVIIFKCSVTPRGVALLIKGLPRLKHLGYEKLHYPLLEISFSKIKTKLNHITVYNELQCHHIYTIMNTCPELKVLKICVPDSCVFLLKELKELCDLEIIYSLNNIFTSPGILTELFFRHSGHQLISLSIMCEHFTTQVLKTICINCHNLQRLSVNCDSFVMINDDLSDDKCLVNLKSFSLTVGDNSFDQTCNIPYSVFHYILQNTHSLEKLVIRMRNNQLNDKFMQVLLKSINVCKLKSLIIYARNVNGIPSSIKLNMETVELIINVCPQLVKLGNIFEWDLSLEEIYYVIRRLKSFNCALDILLNIKSVHLDNL